MFERLMMGAAAMAERRAAARRARLAGSLRGEVPRGVSAEEAGEAVVLAGRGLKRRFALDPALRWFLSGGER
ncbi:MAG TPA: hypothetical protein VGB59_10315 [Allosphingosinicella sp.]|jgi:hypothetical protein